MFGKAWATTVDSIFSVQQIRKKSSGELHFLVYRIVDSCKKDLRAIARRSVIGEW
jgi:hypothetical protein